MSKKMLLSFIFAAAFLLRLLLIPNPGFEADISFWKSWGLATYDRGIVEGIKVTNNNYPTPFAYALGSMVWIYSLFKNPYNFNEFWTNTNLLFLTISKLYPILADLGIAALILYIGTKAKALGFPALSVSFYFLFSVFYLLNPVSLMGGAWWGQMDSLGVFIFLVAFFLAIKGKPFWAGAVFMLSMMTKLQNMIYGPLFFLFIWQQVGFAGLVQSLAGAGAAFFGLNIEFFLSKNMERVISSITVNYDYFPLMSLNAFNLWWVAAGGRGMAVSDKITVLGITNAKSVGLYLFSSFYLFAALRLWGKKDLKTFLEGLVIVNASFFLFQTQSHDRYAFPLIVFLLLWAPFYIVKSPPAGEASDKGKAISKTLRLFTVFYFLFSLLYFYNLNTAMVFNYPNNGLPLLSSLTSPVVTIGVSTAFLGLFAFFVYVLRPLTPALVFLIPALIFFLFLLKANLPLFTRTPVFLTALTPIVSRQDYGSLQINRSLNSSSGIKSWNRLSVQYVFYRYGMGTHTNSLQEFDINRRFARFSADYGIDTEAGPKGSAVFELYGDGKLLWRSDKITRFDLPRHTEVDITGVKLLSLVTTDAGDGNTDDHTDWLRPTLWP